jgi:hypothetical protein
MLAQHNTIAIMILATLCSKRSVLHNQLRKKYNPPMKISNSMPNAQYPIFGHQTKSNHINVRVRYFNGQIYDEVKHVMPFHYRP